MIDEINLTICDESQLAQCSSISIQLCWAGQMEKSHWRIVEEKNSPDFDYKIMNYGWKPLKTAKKSFITNKTLKWQPTHDKSNNETIIWKLIWPHNLRLAQQWPHIWLWHCVKICWVSHSIQHTLSSNAIRNVDVGHFVHIKTSLYL